MHRFPLAPRPFIDNRSAGKPSIGSSGIDIQHHNRVAAIAPERRGRDWQAIDNLVQKRTFALCGPVTQPLNDCRPTLLRRDAFIRQRAKWVEPRGSIAVARTAAIGASCPLQVAPARVPSPNQQPTFRLVGRNWSSYPAFRPSVGASRVEGAADFYSAARGHGEIPRAPAAPAAVRDQPSVPSRIGPNGTYRSPSKRLIWACRIGAKLVGLVLIVMPGNSIGSSRLRRLAACFITFSRVSSSPHCLRTWTVVWAIDWP